ncbi:DNA helicase [Agreia sp.]|uniref:DNA helicase n=1 Tax=Agreia sp. TaxID=1872416 RepID=UPI0035BC40BB
MSLTRKRRKALKKLKGSAEELWLDQQEILDRANQIARVAAGHASELTREEVVPRVRGAVDSIGPIIGRNVAGAKLAAHEVRSRFAHDVLPSVGTALGSAATVLHVANNPSVKRALAKTQPKKAPVGGIVAIVLGVLAAAGVGYALWQTLRADDELWIADDEAVSEAPAG